MKPVLFVHSPELSPYLISEYPNCFTINLDSAYWPCPAVPLHTFTELFPEYTHSAVELLTIFQSNFLAGKADNFA